MFVEELNTAKDVYAGFGHVVAGDCEMVDGVIEGGEYDNIE
jgi:hypothetical protein